MKQPAIWQSSKTIYFPNVFQKITVLDVREFDGHHRHIVTVNDKEENVNNALVQAARLA